MPLIRISLRTGRSDAYKAALVDGVQLALVDAFGIPSDDRFALIDEYEDSSMHFPRTFLGREYSEALVIISITASRGRTATQKAALFAAIAHNLAASPGLVKADLLICVLEVGYEDWSFGDGVPLYPHPPTEPHGS